MRRISFIIAAALALAACKKSSSKDQSEPPADPAAGSAAGAASNAAGEAQKIFVTRCVPCHGLSGHGDGAASASLDPKPRNFSDPSWQASVDDAYIEKIIKYGGAAVGKSAAMPSNPDLSDPAVVTALRSKVRGFGGK